MPRAMRHTATHCRAHCHTLPHTATRTAVYCRIVDAHCRTAAHCCTAAHCGGQTAGRVKSTAHTAACTAAHRRVHFRTAQPRAMPHTAALLAAHCRTVGQPHITAHAPPDSRTLLVRAHTSTRTHCCTLPRAHGRE
jgi:hypothetical protein